MGFEGSYSYASPQSKASQYDRLIARFVTDQSFDEGSSLEEEKENYSDNDKTENVDQKSNFRDQQNIK